MIEKLLPLKPGSVANERAFKRLAQTSTERCRTCSCENAWSVPGVEARWAPDGIQWHSLWPGLRSWQAEVGVFTVRRCAKHPAPTHVGCKRIAAWQHFVSMNQSQGLIEFGS